MVKVTLEEDGYKTIKHECGCAFACLIKPDEAPDGTNAIACLLGNVSIEDMAAGLSKCVLTISHERRGPSRERCGIIQIPVWD